MMVAIDSEKYFGHGGTKFVPGKVVSLAESAGPDAEREGGEGMSDWKCPKCGNEKSWIRNESYGFYYCKKCKRHFRDNGEELRAGEIVFEKSDSAGPDRVIIKVDWKCPKCGWRNGIFNARYGLYYCCHCGRYFTEEGKELKSGQIVWEKSAGPDSVTTDQGHAEKAPETFEEGLDSIIVEERDVMIKKQRDYGHDNILAFGEFGVMVRLWDKMSRLKNLMSKGREPQNESIDDTLIDIANYARIWRMLRRGIFTLPLAEEKAEGGCR